MFDVNSKIAFFFIQHALKNIEDGGSIISILMSLLAAYTPFYSTYQGSKAPVDYFTKAASKEAMSRNVLVNAIAPGLMDTPFFYAQESDEAVAFHKSSAAQGRLTKIEDIIPIVDLLVKGQHWLNGQTIYANGDTPPRYKVHQVQGAAEKKGNEVKMADLSDQCILQRTVYSQARTASVI